MMNEERLVDEIIKAFRERKHPGADGITRCTYDKANGGEFDSPCGECLEMAEFFAERRWDGLTAAELRWHGDTDVLFTVPAYCYFLPALLLAAIREPEVADACVGHLEFRFGPSDDWGIQRLDEILRTLNHAEILAVRAYFDYRRHRWPHHVDEHISRALENLGRSLRSP
jgi:hypothetical protein